VPPKVESRAPRRMEFEVTHGLRLVGDAHGDPAAPPVVLLHGGGQTRHAWGGTAAALAACGWQALALDLRGHGESDWAADGDYSLDTLVADLRAVCGGWTRPAALVGASLGGLTALVAEGESKNALAAALVLVDITPRVQAAGVDRIVGFMTARPDGFASVEEAADAVAAYLPHRPRPRDLAGLRRNLRRGDDGRYRWHWDPRLMSGPSRIDATRDPDRLERAARALRVPTMLVRGRMSELVAEEDARAFLALVPQARYVDVSGAGHMVAGDRNDPFTDAVVEFLTAHRT
jgi:pimeloyl-ACP methyl ester carboxylesterase